MRNSITFNPIFRTLKKPDPPTVFVLMPFDKEFNTIFDKYIKPVVESKQIRRKKPKCNRADSINQPGKPVMNKIWTYIISSRYIVVELTGLNTNVFYELGIADTVGIPVIMLWDKSKSKGNPPFDVKVREIIFYDSNDMTGFENELKKSIQTILRTPPPKKLIEETKSLMKIGLNGTWKSSFRANNMDFNVVLNFFDENNEIIAVMVLQWKDRSYENKIKERFSVIIEEKYIRMNGIDFEVLWNDSVDYTYELDNFILKLDEDGKKLKGKLICSETESDVIFNKVQLDS